MEQDFFEEDKEETTLSLFTKREWKKILIAIMIICVCIILTLTFVVRKEMKEARINCEEFGGEYSIKDWKYYCDDKPFYKYNNGVWNTEMIVETDLLNKQVEN